MLFATKLRLRVALAGLAAVPLLAGSAAADKLVFTGTHGVTFSPNFGIPAELTAAGVGVATVNGGVGGSPTLSTLQLTEHFAQIDEEVEITAAGLATKIPKVRLEGVRIAPELQGGIFGPILAAVQGGLTTMGDPVTPLNTSQRTLPAAGTIRLCRVFACNTTTTPPVTQMLNQATTMGGVVGPGVDDTTFVITRTPPPTGTGFTLLLQGAEWTVNTATVMYQTVTGTMGTVATQTLTGMGFVQGPSSNTGTTLSPTSDPTSGTVQLVTPIQIQALSGFSAPHQLSGMIVRLTLHFQPEPGRLALLGSGALVLAALGWRRSRA